MITRKPRQADPIEDELRRAAPEFVGLQETRAEQIFDRSYQRFANNDAHGIEVHRPLRRRKMVALAILAMAMGLQFRSYRIDQTHIVNATPPVKASPSTHYGDTAPSLIKTIAGSKPKGATLRVTASGIRYNLALGVRHRNAAGLYPTSQAELTEPEPIQFRYEIPQDETDVFTNLVAADRSDLGINVEYSSAPNMGTATVQAVFFEKNGSSRWRTCSSTEHVNGEFESTLLEELRSPDTMRQSLSIVASAYHVPMVEGY